MISSCGPFWDLNVYVSEGSANHPSLILVAPARRPQARGLSGDTLPCLGKVRTRNAFEVLPATKSSPCSHSAASRDPSPIRCRSHRSVHGPARTEPLAPHHRHDRGQTRRRVWHLVLPYQRLGRVNTHDLENMSAGLCSRAALAVMRLFAILASTRHTCATRTLMLLCKGHQPESHESQAHKVTYYLSIY